MAGFLLCKVFLKKYNIFLDIHKYTIIIIDKTNKRIKKGGNYDNKKYQG